MRLLPRGTYAVLPLLFLAGCAGTGLEGARRDMPEPPAAQAILDLAAKTSFAAEAVTDDDVADEIKALNRDFGIRVFFRTSAESYSEEEGVVAAKIELRGIPERYGISDGGYFLWLGGKIKETRAFLASPKRSRLIELEVRYKPSLPEQAKPHKPKIHGVVEEAALPLPGTPPLPHPPRPPPPPPPRRTWREICYPYAPTDHGAPGGWRWVRVPDN